MVRHYFVARVRNDGGRLRIGVAKDGQPAYVTHPGDEIRLADLESAQRLIRLVRHVGLPGGGFKDNYEAVEVNDG